MKKNLVGFWVFCLGLLAMVLPAQASLTNVVTVTSDNVSFDASVIVLLLGGLVAVALGGGLAIKIGVRVGKWIANVILGLMGSR